MATMRAAFGDITNTGASAGTAAQAPQKAAAGAAHEDDEQQNAEEWAYPESMLRLRRERCFALRDFDTMPKRLGHGKFGACSREARGSARRREEREKAAHPPPPHTPVPPSTPQARSTRSVRHGPAACSS
jgi:hypothetical protein